MVLDCSKPVGIVAGWGHYPVVVAESLRQQNRSVIVAGIRDHASTELQTLAQAFQWFGVAKLGGYQRFFARHGVEQVILAGKVFKDRLLFRGLGWMGLAPDWECIKTFFPHFVLRNRDTRDDSLLNAVVASFERHGMNIVAGTDIAPQLLIEEGNLTRTRPTFVMQKDMEFGWDIAKRMGDLDIGQSVTVRDQTILCVEAVEGTDACIARTASVCPRGGFTLVKVAKPKQDMRFDLPTIGIKTLERLAQAGGKAILIEAGRTIFLDREQVLQYADRHGIAIVARRDSEVARKAA